jgi:hypothetical protein
VIFESLWLEFREDCRFAVAAADDPVAAALRAAVDIDDARRSGPPCGAMNDAKSTRASGGVDVPDLRWIAMSPP